MDSISTLRIIKTGFVNFWRNLWLSAAATMVMTITLIIFAVLFLLFAVTSYSVKGIQDRVDVSIYMKKGADESKILAFKSQLESDSTIQSVTYVSAQQALADFKSRHQSDSNITTAINVLDENPLLATLQVKAKNLSDYPNIAAKVSGNQYQDLVDKVNYNDNRDVINRLSRILKIIVTIGVALIIVFSLIAVLVIFNTIALTIHNRKEEVEIMRLVGATNWYIRGPFLTEAVLYSFFSTLIAGALFYPVFSSILPRITEFVSPQVQVFNTNLFNYWYLLIILLLISIFLSFFSTYLAIRKYLRI